MIDGWTIVLDIGKTHTKVSLHDEAGRLRSGDSYVNQARQGPGYPALDIVGIDEFLLGALAACAQSGPVRRIIPVAHGAALAIVQDGALACPPMDYEAAIPESERSAYAAERDPFAATGSPLLPAALNAGLQLAHLESLRGPLSGNAKILTWPQYWAWRLCGVPACEVTSLGCHSDLWRPVERCYSSLVHRRGWMLRMARLSPADSVLGCVTAEVAAATGLATDCAVLCGLHDSNAALLALRGHAEMAGRDATVLSTGTWFVAMRSLPAGTDFDFAALEESRDCLVNVDTEGRPVPSARFMGGREADIIRAAGAGAATAAPVSSGPEPGLRELLARGAVARPGFVPGVGPYPQAVASLSPPDPQPAERRALAALYLALMSAAILDLIDSQQCLLVEGPFAADEIFVGALATLRDRQQVYTCSGRDDLAYGALRLLAPALAPPAGLRQVAPIEVELKAYAEDWRRQAEASRRVA